MKVILEVYEPNGLDLITTTTVASDRPSVLAEFIADVKQEFHDKLVKESDPNNPQMVLC